MEVMVVGGGIEAGEGVFRTPAKAFGPRGVGRESSEASPDPARPLRVFASGFRREPPSGTPDDAEVQASSGPMSSTVYVTVSTPELCLSFTGSLLVIRRIP